jgi:hypothetical protein
MSPQPRCGWLVATLTLGIVVQTGSGSGLDDSTVEVVTEDAKTGTRVKVVVSRTSGHLSLPAVAVELGSGVGSISIDIGDPSPHGSCWRGSTADGDGYMDTVKSTDDTPTPGTIFTDEWESAGLTAKFQANYAVRPFCGADIAVPGYGSEPPAVLEGEFCTCARGKLSASLAPLCALERDIVCAWFHLGPLACCET